MTKELIKQAFDANAWIYLGNAEGQAVAPAMFDEMVRDYQSKALVVAPLAEQVDFTRPGSSWTVTIDEAPTAAALTAETAGAQVSAITTRQVTFTPKEYTKKYEASYTQMEDGFLPFMSNASKKIGYSMADQKDQVCVTALYNANGIHNVFANGKTAASLVTATDFINRNLIARAFAKIETALYTPQDLIINSNQKMTLLNEPSFFKANEFGTRAAISSGFLGNIYGFNIYKSDNLAPNGNVVKAIALGATRSGEKAFGLAFARKPTVETDKDITFRQVLIVGSERYDVQVYHPEAVCLLHTANAVPTE